MNRFFNPSLFRLIALAFALLAPVLVDAQTGVRTTSSFDKDWLFARDEQTGAEALTFNDSAWRKLDVPHDWSIEGPFDAANKTGGAGGFLPAGIGWYRKHFRLPDGSNGKRVYIEFDGVMANSTVWINGHQLGTRPNGYVSFGYELTDQIRANDDNVIAVRVDNSGQPASRWYTGAGIYRHVRLVVTSPVHTEKWSTFVHTPNIGPEWAVVNVTTTVMNESAATSRVQLKVTIRDPKGRMVGTTTEVVGPIVAGSAGAESVSIPVPRPILWSLESPNLYTAEVKVISDKKVTDEEIVTFGIRRIDFVPATGFWLNGKNFKIKGVCLHHDGSAFGAAVPLSVWEQRLTTLRTLGVNAIRTAHNPPSPEFLELADRMGFLVMDELFDQWTLAKNPFDYHKDFKVWSKIDVRDTVRRDRNHPSVIIYSAGNEIRDNHGDQEKAKDTLRGLVETFHANDPTRPVTQALFRPNIEGARDYDNGLAEILDVVGQNYREKEILAAYKQKPTRKILGTENTHDLNQWVAMRDHPEYSGQFIWVGVDYLGESRTFPNYAFGKGLLDRVGTIRPVGYQRQSWWSNEPMVHMSRRVALTEASPTDPGYEIDEARRTQVLFSDWTPKNLSAHEENVEVYSNCDEVELFLNGRSLGSKPKNADDSPRNWKVPFESGTIKAVGKNSGKAVAEDSLMTAGKPASIQLSVNRSTTSNGWDDVVFVSARVVDANGVLIPRANDLIEFTVDGPGRIVAVDSGDNTDLAPFQTTQRKAFQGLAIGYLKASDGGKLTVTARAPGLSSNKVLITSVR